jgi:hypothetical protein
VPLSLLLQSPEGVEIGVECVLLGPHQATIVVCNALDPGPSQLILLHSGAFMQYIRGCQTSLSESPTAQLSFLRL